MRRGTDDAVKRVAGGEREGRAGGESHLDLWGEGGAEGCKDGRRAN